MRGPFIRDFSSCSEEDFLSIVNPHDLPTHIAIIMDGNGRWASQRNLPRVAGHKAGMKTVKEVVSACGKIGIKYLTLYAFSVENWKRPVEEVSTLMNLLIEYLRRELNELHKNKVRLTMIGDINGLPKGVQLELKEAFKKTAGNDGLILNLALNYSGRREIISAIKHIVRDVIEGRLSLREVENLREEDVSRFLYTKDIPDPDLLIRTSGEMRLSNFLLWQSAYTELWVTSILWPDFTKGVLFKAILDYQMRERRFGGVKISKNQMCKGM